MYGLPVLDMLIECGLLFHNIVDLVCICYLFLFAICLLHGSWFAMPGLVLLLFCFLFLLIDNDDFLFLLLLSSFLFSCGC
jgi:hypothetical protein